MNEILQNGNTPLHIAAYSDGKSCFKLLLSHGADENLMNNVKIFVL